MTVVHAAAEARPAPPDEECDRAYAGLVAMALEHGMLSYAYGGVMIVATPAVQREQGERERILLLNNMTEHTL